MMFGPFAATIAKTIGEFYSGLQFDLPLSDGWPAPSEYAFGKTLTTSTHTFFLCRFGKFYFFSGPYTNLIAHGSAKLVSAIYPSHHGQ
jgi:hypothetical protein